MHLREIEIKDLDSCAPATSLITFIPPTYTHPALAEKVSFDQFSMLFQEIIKVHLFIVKLCYFQICLPQSLEAPSQGGDQSVARSHRGGLMANLRWICEHLYEQGWILN